MSESITSGGQPHSLVSTCFSSTASLHLRQACGWQAELQYLHLRHAYYGLHARLGRSVHVAPAAESALCQSTSAWMLCVWVDAHAGALTVGP